MIEFPEKDRHGINSSSASSYEDEDTPELALTSRKDPEEGEAAEESEDEDIDRYEDDELRRAIAEDLEHPDTKCSRKTNQMKLKRKRSKLT